MTIYYADNYEELTGKKPETVVEEATPTETVISEPVTKDVTAESDDVHTA